MIEGRPRPSSAQSEGSQAHRGLYRASVNETKTAPPAFVGNKPTKTSYYGTAGTYQNFPAEGAYITCRGPLFPGAMIVMSLNWPVSKPSPPSSRQSYRAPENRGCFGRILSAGMPWLTRPC